jgi:tripartite-type tricarboxylate transporter receptor subunit TctC
LNAGNSCTWPPVLSQCRPSRATAQTYPTRPVRIIVGFAGGSSPDITARLIGQCLSERLGQQFVIENRPGAGGNIGTEAVVNASPDGYTLLFVGANNAINATLYNKLKFDFARDIAPVASIGRVPNIMEVSPKFPVKTVPEFIDCAKANPGKINFASPGIGTSIHLSGELFKMLTGINMVHVAYRSTSAALTDVMTGQVQAMFDNMPSSIEFIRDGRLRALAVTTATRWEGLPTVPTIGDFVPGFQASAIGGIGAPRNTPAAIITKLNSEINAWLADPKLTAQFAELGTTISALSPFDFGALLGAEIDKWGKVVKFAGVKVD